MWSPAIRLRWAGQAATYTKSVFASTAPETGKVLADRGQSVVNDSIASTGCQEHFSVSKYRQACCAQCTRIRGTQRRLLQSPHYPRGMTVSSSSAGCRSALVPRIDIRSSPLGPPLLRRGAGPDQLKCCGNTLQGQGVALAVQKIDCRDCVASRFSVAGRLYCITTSITPTGAIPDFSL